MAPGRGEPRAGLRAAVHGAGPEATALERTLWSCPFSAHGPSSQSPRTGAAPTEDSTDVWILLEEHLKSFSSLKVTS